jgi:hypothetical protein
VPPCKVTSYQSYLTPDFHVFAASKLEVGCLWPSAKVVSYLRYYRRAVERPLLTPNRHLRPSYPALLAARFLIADVSNNEHGGRDLSAHIA